MHQYLIVSALLTFIGVPADADNGRTWELVKDDDGMKVWTREVPGSDIHEVKAETVIEAPVERIWEVLVDSEAYPEFMPYIVESKIIESGPDGQIEYQRVDPPLVSERDYTVRVMLEVDGVKGRYERHWEAANEKGPAKPEGVVRLPVNEGKWTLQRLDEHRTRVEYYLYTDPGGSIPSWLTNFGNTRTLPRLFKAVEKRATDPDWTD